MLYAEHIYSLRSSTLLSVYLSITILLSIARSRSYFLRDGLQAAGGVTVTATFLKCAILALEEISKRELVANEDLRKAGDETFAGFWNRAMFFWMNSTFMHGYKAILSMNDLQALPLELMSERLYEEFSSIWDKGMLLRDKSQRGCLINTISTAKKDSKYSLLLTCLRTLRSKFYAAVVSTFCALSFSFAQPFLILRTVEAVNEPDLPGSVVGGIIGAYALTYFALAVSFFVYTIL